LKRDNWTKLRILAAHAGFALPRRDWETANGLQGETFADNNLRESPKADGYAKKEDRGRHP